MRNNEILRRYFYTFDGEDFFTSLTAAAKAADDYIPDDPSEEVIPIKKELFGFPDEKEGVIRWRKVMNHANEVVLTTPLLK